MQLHVMHVDLNMCYKINRTKHKINMKEKIIYRKQTIQNFKVNM